MRHSDGHSGRREKRTGTVVFALLFLAIAPAGCSRPGRLNAEPAEEAQDATPPKLAVTPVRLEIWPRVVRVQGALVADDQVVVGAKVAGRVKQLGVDLRKTPVDVGSPVQQGSVLVSLDTEELDLRVELAKAQLAQACAKLGVAPEEDEKKKDKTQVPTVKQEAALRHQAEDNWKRTSDLRARQQEAVTEEEVDARKAAWDAAQARYEAAVNDAAEQIQLIGVRRADLALAKQIRADAEIRAPFDGIVEQRYVAPGAYLQAGQAVVSLVRIDKLRFRAGVPEREAVAVREKQKVAVRVEGESAVLEAEVSRTAPALETSNRSLIVEADLPNPGLRLRAGLFAEAEILVDPDAKTLAVAAGAVTEFAGVEKVWLIRQGQAAEKIVQTGRRDRNRVEILQGLSPGDLVAADARQARRGPVEIEQAEGGRR